MTQEEEMSQVSDIINLLEEAQGLLDELIQLDLDAEDSATRKDTYDSNATELGSIVHDFRTLDIFY